MSASHATPPSLCYGFLNKFHLLHGHLLHDQKFYGHMYPGQLLLRPLPLDIQSLTKIWSAVPEKWLLGQMLPGQMSPGQMLHEQMLHGQLLPGQVFIGQILTRFGQSSTTSVVKNWSITPEIWLPGQVSLEQLSLGQMSMEQMLQGHMSRYIILHWAEKNNILAYLNPFLEASKVRLFTGW